MGATTITFRVDDAEHHELVVRAERDKVSLSDYVRVRLGLRGQGSQSNDEVETDPRYAALGEQLSDHDRRLHALEDQVGERQAAMSRNGPT